MRLVRNVNLKEDYSLHGEYTHSRHSKRVKVRLANQKRRGTYKHDLVRRLRNSIQITKLKNRMRKV